MPAREQTPATVASSDDKPRRILIEAASEVFSAVGYDSATIREICLRAGMNVAAVNYHFGDKLALYTATLQFAIASEGVPGPVNGLESLPPEEALRTFLKNTYSHFARSDHPAFYTRIMLRELAVPTAGFNTVVERLVRPRMMILVDIVGRLLDLPPTHKKARLAAHSIIGQAVHYVQGRPLISLLWPDWTIDPEQMEEVINHIADFSIAALRAMKESPKDSTPDTGQVAAKAQAH